MRYPPSPSPPQSAALLQLPAMNLLGQNISVPLTGNSFNCVKGHSARGENAQPKFNGGVGLVYKLLSLSLSLFLLLLLFLLLFLLPLLLSLK